MQKLVITRWQQGIMAMLLENEIETEIQYSEPEEIAVGNIYIAKVKNVVQNIHAVFVEISSDRTCYLSLEDAKCPIYLNRVNDRARSLAQGDEILVQVMKAAIKTKDAVVTTNLSFAGKYAVLTTGNRKLGVSMKLEETVRRRLKKSLESCVPEDVGIVIRTNAAYAEEADIIEEISRLDESRKQLIEKAQHRTCYSVMYRSPENFLTFIRDLRQEEAVEIITDDQVLFERIQKELPFLREQDERSQVRLYQDKLLPLSKVYSLESKLEKALNQRVWLKSGGYLIIEPTEALTVIDVNTGKFAGKKDVQETFFKINLEAAKEIARQLRLRNLSGIIIVDFINMESSESRRMLMEALDEYTKHDRIKTDVLDMTALNLVELTRKKVDKPLHEVLR